jgi:hypothetical protein
MSESQVKNEVRKFRTQEKRLEIEENLKIAMKEGVISYKEYVSESVRQIFFLS